jgi:hypothetical protein
MNNGQSFHVARYGYLLETARFLEDVEAYRKNFRVFDYPLIYDGRMKREDFLRDSEETNRTLAWLSEKSGQSGTNRESCYIQMLNYNWGLYSGLRDAGEKYDYRGKKNKVSMMIYGRNKKDDPVPKISGTTSLLRQENLDYETGEAKQDAYEFNLTGRKTIFRFALAAGHEDDVEDYLRLAGYASGEEQTERREWYTDEAVVEYAKRYRDALVEKWAQEWSQADGVDITQLQEEIRSRFPFIRLVATINRDVELVMRYDREWQGKRPMSEKEMEKEIQQYCNDMVYPIYEINAVWFDWYREHIKWT